MRMRAAVAVVFGSLAAGPVVAQNAWQEFRCPEGGFRVMLPGKPEAAPMPGAHPGMETRQYRLVVPPVAYAVGYATYPPAVQNVLKSDTVLSLFRDGVLQAAGSTPVSESPISVSGLPGKELRLSAKSGRAGVCRVVAGKGRLYFILATAEVATLSSPEVQRAMKSFRIQPEESSPEKEAPSEAAPRVTVRSVATPTSASPRVAAPTAPVWKEFRSEHGGFAVTAPGPLAYVKPAGKAGSSTRHRFTLQKGDELFEAAFQDSAECDASQAQALLDTARNHVVDGLRGKLTNDQPVNLGEVPGREFRAEVPGGRSVLVRLYLSGNRLHQLSVTTPVQQSYSDASVKFLSSFRFLGK